MERLRTRTHQARVLEWALVLLFILVLSWVLMSRYEALEERHLKIVARYEHRLLQTRIQIFRVRHGEWPESLVQALGKPPRKALLVGPHTKRDRLVGKGGRLMDPFGEPYRYYPESGRVEGGGGIAKNPHPD